MFKVSENTELQTQIQDAEKNYVIRPNDLLSLEVYTNKGERIIDPDYKLTKDLPSQTALADRDEMTYLVNPEGKAKFPMVGEVMIQDLTLREAEEILQQEYSKYYQDPYAVLKYESKRVIILGAPGGQVVPLIHQNVSLVEVLALAKGINNDAKAANIRVLRGDKVFLVDFSTIEGYKKNNMIMEPGDVVYVEPLRRPFYEGFRDYGPALSVLASLTTLIIVLIDNN